MRTAALIFSLVLFIIVIFGALRAVLSSRLPFVKKLDSTTRDGFIALSVAAAGLLAFAFIDVGRVESVEIAGVKAKLSIVQQKVDVVSDQVEALFRRKRIEIFDKQNWGRVRTVGRRKDGGFMLEVTLEQEPIPESIEIYDGVLQMPEQDFTMSGRTIRFPANSNEPDLTLTIKYYPRLAPQHGRTQ